LVAKDIFLNFLVMGDDVFPLHALTSGSEWCSQVSSPVIISCTEVSFSSQHHCRKCFRISMHACSCSLVHCLGIYLAQILPYPGSSWMMEYTDPQLMYDFSDISVTVLYSHGSEH
jgi:hypothetical protein